MLKCGKYFYKHLKFIYPFKVNLCVLKKDVPYDSDFRRNLTRIRFIFEEKPLKTDTFLLRIVLKK